MHKPLQVYIRRSNTVAPNLLSANPISVAVNLAPLPNPEPRTTDPPLPTVELDPSASSNLDLPIALCKGK